MIKTGQSKYVGGTLGFGGALPLGSLKNASVNLNKKLCKSHKWTQGRYNCHCSRCGLEAVKDPVTGHWKPWNSV